MRLDSSETAARQAPSAPPGDDNPFAATGSRRKFVRNAAASLIASHPVLAALERSDMLLAQPSTALKTRAQYQSEAAEFESAVRNLSGYASMTVKSDADIARLTSLVESAASRLDLHHSWLVSICMMDSGLVAWVRKEIRDESTFNQFIEKIRRDPRSIDAISGVAALRERLSSMQREKRALLSSLINSERRILGIEAFAAEARSKAATAQECQKTWAIVAAICLIVVAIVVMIVAAVGSPWSEAMVTGAANSLANSYRGTGPDLAAGEFQKADQRYRQCRSQAATLPPEQRARAIAACQASWLEEKAVQIA